MKPNFSLWSFFILIVGIYPLLNYSFQNSSIPFIWVGLYSLIILFLLIYLFRNRTIYQQFFLYSAVVIMALTSFEAYLLFSSEQRDATQINRAGTMERDDVLGYKPVANQQFNHTKTVGGEVIFSVDYKIDKNGMRISPPYNPDSLAGDCLFFGGSFTFGSGVKDIETLPYQVGLQSDGKYRTFNFGYGGYGPHQMLSALRNGIPEQVIPDDKLPKYVFYQAIVGHLYRAAGRVFWDPHGPRFIFNEKDEIIYEGNFDHNRTHLDWLTNHLKKSLIYKKRVYRHSGIGEEEIDLFVDIVSASRKECETLFSNSKFYVLFWDEDKKMHRKVIAALQNRGITVLFIRDILTEQNLDRYLLHKYDRHPNPLAYERIADYLVKNILKD